MRDDKLKFIARGSLFLIICFSPFIFQILLPSDHFTFRVWEAVGYSLTPDKPFYSNMYIKKIEVGDLGPGTEFAVEKNVVWQTDEYGYRNVPSKNQEYDVVIIGDSFTAGSGLSQKETLSSVLAQKTGLNVYSFASADINKFLSEKRFIDNPPRILIIENIERGIWNLPPIDQNVIIRNRIPHPFIEKAIDGFDSLRKMSIVRYYISRIKEHDTPRELIVNTDTKMLFYSGSFYQQEINLNARNATISTLISYDNYLRQKGIEFIFLPVPDKETIYFSDLPAEYASFRRESPFLRGLVNDLNKANITVINTIDTFRRHKANNVSLYPLDDSHWNPAGVNITVGLISDKLHSHGVIESSSSAS